MIYVRLFLEFFQTGLFAVGGGLATLPFLYSISDRTGWFTHSQLADMLAISESTPGPIGINTATYAGFLTSGISGAITATLGLITPSIIVILIIYAFLQAFRGNFYVESVFYGLRPASTAMITAAGLIVARITFLNPEINFKTIILAIVLLILTNAINRTKNLHPVVWIIFSAIVGIIFEF